MFEKVEKLELKKWKKHIFLCTESGEWKCCDWDFWVVWNYLKKRSNELKLEGTVNILRTKANCLRVCEKWPVWVVYPDWVWYHSLDIENLEKIIQKHLIGWEIVQELVIFENDFKNFN